MLKIENLTNFEGFGNGDKAGEYYDSQNMMKSRNGILTGWKTAKTLDTSDYASLGVINWFVECAVSGVPTVFALDENGRFYKDSVLHYQPDSTNNDMASGYNGLISDQTNRLIFFGKRYGGKYVDTADYTTGTIEATNGSNAIVGTGTTFTSGMVGKRIRIGAETVFYTISAYTDATHITLSSNYAGITGSGKTYRIFSGWSDKVATWDLGADSLYKKPMDLYEDYVLIGNKNKIALINITDDSFDSAGFTLPTGFEITAVKSNKSGVLIGANLNNKSILFLWDVYTDRSKAPWIWLNEIIKSIAKYDDNWIVITDRNIYLTDGYSTKKIATVQEKFNYIGFTNYIIPQGSLVINDKLFFFGRSGLYGKIKSGIYILNILSGLYEFMPASNSVLYGATGGAIFASSLGSIYYSYSTGNPSYNAIAYIAEAIPFTASYIVKGGSTSNQKVAEGVKVSMVPNQPYGDKKLITFDLSLKIAKLNRHMHGYGIQKATETDKGQITINGTTSVYYDAEAGDEITVLDGANAGQIRHISTITGKGTANEVWTLDSDLPNVMTINDSFAISPFKLVKKYTYTDNDDLDYLYFNIKNKLTSNEFYLKFVFENLVCPIEIKNVLFIYDELPIL